MSPERMMNELLDFEPQIAFSHFGPERSIRWILEWFYKQNGIEAEKAKAITQSYAAALEALLADALHPTQQAGGGQ